MERETVVKWLKFISFGFLLLGGLNWLFIGLFEADIIGGIFGGADSAASRVIFSLVGISAVILLTIVLVKAFAKMEEPKKATTQTKTAASE
ncbi:MAG: DUF378 domain-containing protein [Firmicutes bacterium]|nr:DUF378 domain-containing protein [Bacillota bacterium]